MRTLGWTLLGLAMLSACSPSDGDSNNYSDRHVFDHDVLVNNNNVNSNSNTNTAWQPPLNSRIYVNTEENLYYIDPGVSSELVFIGAFSGPCTSDSGFYDIAVNDKGAILGISALGLYHVDSETAACTYAHQFQAGSPHYFSLSYVKGVDTLEPSADKLIAASAEHGEWVMIDYAASVPEDVFVSLGYYDYPDMEWLSSGDIVSIQVDWTEYVTYATLKCPNYVDPGCESDWLAEIDPDSGNARLIGPTGYQQIFGLGFWGDRLYGFTNDGEYITINVDTGVGTLVESYAGQSFWGAGNTTIPYIVL